MKFYLPSDLNVEFIKSEFSIDNRVQIPNIISKDLALDFFDFLQKEVTYDQALILNNRAELLSLKKMKSLKQTEFKALINNVYDNAAKGIGFWYGRASDKEKEQEKLINFENWLNSSEVINFIKQITGQFDIYKTVLQFTRYNPGDFLTRHKDLGADNNRKIAFVFHFSPHWHPDWGGLLQFYQQDGQPRDSWSPRFGSLHLFDTRHIHAVTSISPFATAARYSVSGWFINR